VGRIELTVHSRAILKIVKSMCNDIKIIKCTLMKCHTNVNYTPPTQLPHKFSYIVVIFIHNHFGHFTLKVKTVMLMSHFFCSQYVVIDKTQITLAFLILFEQIKKQQPSPKMSSVLPILKTIVSSFCRFPLK
jgi:hypothetical protein